MDIIALKNCLRPWMQTSTWCTGLPADDARFHTALNEAFFELGPSIQSMHFHQAMLELLHELHPNYSPGDRSEEILPFVIAAKIIGMYLLDTKNL
jgi:hypothetical protein